MFHRLREYNKGIKKLKIKGEKGQEGLEKISHNELKNKI